MVPARIASRASRIRRTRKCTLCRESRRSPRISSDDEEVPDVRPRESAAGGAVAVVVERPWVGAELGALDVEAAVAGERGAVPAHARGRDAVEEVDAAQHAFDEIFGKADAHEVARPVARQLAVDDLEDAVHVGLRFADRESADAEAGPVAGVANGARGVAAEGCVDAALNDREEGLGVIWCGEREGGAGEGAASAAVT